MRYCVAWVLIVGTLSAFTAWGYWLGRRDAEADGRAQGRAVNRLLSVGFRVVDPEGCEVARFEE